MGPGSSVARGQQEMKTPAMGLGGSMSGGREKARGWGASAPLTSALDPPSTS